MSPPISATTSNSVVASANSSAPVNLLSSSMHHNINSSSSLSSSSSLTDFDFIFNEASMIGFGNDSHHLNFGDLGTGAGSSGGHLGADHSTLFGSSPPNSLSLSPLNGSTQNAVHQSSSNMGYLQNCSNGINIINHSSSNSNQNNNGAISTSVNMSSSGNFSFNSSDFESVAAAFSFDKLNNSFSNGTLLDICNGLDSFSNSLTGSFCQTSAPPPSQPAINTAAPVTNNGNLSNTSNVNQSTSFANYNSCSSYSMNNFHTNFLNFGLFDEDDDYEENAKEVDSDRDLDDLHSHDYSCLASDVAYNDLNNPCDINSVHPSATIHNSQHQASNGSAFDDFRQSSHTDQLNDSDTLIAIREMAIKEKIQYQQQQHQRKHKNSTSSVSSITNIKKVAIELKQSANQVASSNYSPVSIVATGSGMSSNNSSTMTNSHHHQQQQHSFKTSLSLDDLNDEFYDATTTSNASGLATSASANDLQPFLDIEDWEQMLDEDCISRLTNEVPPNTGPSSGVNVTTTTTTTTTSCNPKGNMMTNGSHATKASIIISNGTALSSSVSTPTLSVTPLKLPTTTATIISATSITSKMQHNSVNSSALASSASSNALISSGSGAVGKPPQPVVVYLSNPNVNGNTSSNLSTTSLTQIVPNASNTATTIHIKSNNAAIGQKHNTISKTSPTTTTINNSHIKKVNYQENAYNSNGLTAHSVSQPGATTTTTTIITANKVSAMPANMFKRFNSVVINDARLSTVNTNSLPGTTTTVTATSNIEANSGNVKNLTRKNSKTNQQSMITATTASPVDNDPSKTAGLLKSKNVTTTATTTTTTTTTVSVNQTNSAGYSSLKLPQNSQLSVSTVNNPPSTGANTTSPSNTASVSNTSTTPSSSSSLIDHCDIIDCVNPDQIFPCRPTFRYASVNVDNDEFDAFGHGSNGHHFNSFFKNKLNSVEDDDDEEEEIDVVSVNSTGHNHLLPQQQQQQQHQYHHQATQLSSSNSSYPLNNSNHNHHNYFYQPVSSASRRPVTVSNQSSTTKSNQLVFIKNDNQELASSAGNQSASSPSLLAKYLKSPASNNSSNSNTTSIVSYQTKSSPLAASKLIQNQSTSSVNTNTKSSAPNNHSSNVSNTSTENPSSNFTTTLKTSRSSINTGMTKNELNTKANSTRNKKANNSTLLPPPSTQIAPPSTISILSSSSGNLMKTATSLPPAIKATQPTTLLHSSSQFKIAGTCPNASTSSLSENPALTTTTTKYVTMTATKLATATANAKPTTKVITTTTTPITMLNQNGTHFSHYSPLAGPTTAFNSTTNGVCNAKPSIIGANGQPAGITSIKTFASKKLIQRINLPSLSPSQVLHETTPSSVDEMNRMFKSNLKNNANLSLNSTITTTVGNSVAAKNAEKRPGSGRSRKNLDRPNGLAVRRRQRQRQNAGGNFNANSVDDDDLAHYIEDSDSLNNFNLDLLATNDRDSFDVDSAVDDDDEDSISDDDDDDDDDDELSDDEDDDYSSSVLSPSCSSRNANSPLTSSNISSLSSGSNCSTPTKNARGNKKHVKGLKPSKKSFDMDMLNEKLSKKAAAKALKASQANNTSSSSSNNLSSLSSLGSSVSISSASSNNSPNNGNGTNGKRGHRHQTLGYLSDNPAEKRAFHILSERQRRNDLKKLFETLRTNIPNLCDKQKASKLTILKAAVDHLADVSQKKEKLHSTYEKEKQKQAQLMQHLKSLQQQQQQQQQQQTYNSTTSSYGHHSNQGPSAIRMVVH